MFFHCSAVDAELDSLTIGQQVQYLPDESAPKPRAKSVIAGTGTGTPRSGQRQGTDRSTRVTAQRPRRLETFDFGFVTKLRRRKMEGAISSVQGGAEYLFEAASVIGKKDYYHLDVGDYVRFAKQVDSSDPKQPYARSVMAVHRPVAGREDDTPQHPRSRRKKPTWR